MKNNYLHKSDKAYWHRFLPIYETALCEISECTNILEFGVFKGDSIRWLNEKYPDANIYGCDILEIQKEWTQAKNIKYIKIDQGDPLAIKLLFENIKMEMDLIIEDGSHFPIHQKNCLVESLKHIKKGGIYILEDIHTSHPEHRYYKQTIKELNPTKIWKRNNYISSLHLLLCYEHLISNNIDLTEKLIDRLSMESLFNKDELAYIFSKIAEIKIHKRAHLPHRCYMCGSNEYDYHNLKCRCGENLYSQSDSMTAIIKTR